MYRANAFAPAATPVVLYGESGTGKTFFAQYIHDLSQRAGGFHVLSVGTLSAELVLDQLFGHVEGGFTGAGRPRPGAIVTAGGGTLVLDDVQTLDLSVQPKLLQVLDRGTFTQVGSDRILVAACRFVLAMTEEPDALMKKGILLKDLRYRFGACAIRIPPLLERRAEIPLLAKQALQRCPEETKVEGPLSFTEAALALLVDGEYEGNVRELAAVVEYAYLMARAAGAGEIGPEHVPEGLCPVLRYQRRGDREANRVVVQQALRRAGGNATQAAKLLGMSRNALNSLRAASKRSPPVES